MELEVQLQESEDSPFFLLGRVLFVKELDEVFGFE
jgi:hypothetical protein